MAFDVAQDGEQPKFTVLSKYEVTRIGEFPTATATFTECVFILDGTGSVTLAEDVDGDGKKEVLTIPTFGLIPTSQLLQHTLAFADSAVIGTIVAAEKITVQEEVKDGTGVITTPGIYSMKVTLGAPPATDLTNAKVGVVKKMPVGTPAYRKARSGKEWSIHLNGSDANQMGQMAAMLGSIYFIAGKTLLAALNLSKTDAEIAAALQMLAATQTNIDGIFASVGEKMELDRRANAFPWMLPWGDAPHVN